MSLIPFALSLIPASTPSAPVVSDASLHILIGQSNMHGTADMSDLPSAYAGEKSNVKIWNGSSFENLNSTLNNNQYPVPNDHFGPEFSFLVDRANLTGQVQYCIKIALGSTGLYAGSSLVTGDNPGAKDWSPSTDGLYADLIEALDAAKIVLNNMDIEPRVASILWVQGERDAGNATWAAAYEANLEDLFFDNLIPYIESEIDITATNIPILIPRLQSLGGWSEINTIRTAQYNFFAAHSNVYLFDTDIFPLLVDNIHYSFLGYLWIGQNALSKLSGNYELNEDWLAASPASITVTNPADSITITNGPNTLLFSNAHSGTVSVYTNKAETGFVLASSGQVSVMCYMHWSDPTIPVSTHFFSLYKDDNNLARIQSRNTADGNRFRLTIRIAGTFVYDAEVSFNRIALVKITYDYATNEIKFWHMALTSTTNEWVQMGTTQTLSLATAGQQLKVLFSGSDSAADVGGDTGVYRKLFMQNALFNTAFPY